MCACKCVCVCVCVCVCLRCTDMYWPSTGMLIGDLVKVMGYLEVGLHAALNKSFLLFPSPASTQN